VNLADCLKAGTNMTKPQLRSYSVVCRLLPMLVRRYQRRGVHAALSAEHVIESMLLAGCMIQNPFRYFKTSREVIQLAVLMYVRFPLSLRYVEDLLNERGIDLCHQSISLCDHCLASLNR
jgi:hypothetical protein